MRTSTSAKTYTITEYGWFSRGGQGQGALPEPVFDELEDFILADPQTEFLSLSIRRGSGKVVTARNYVGVISLKGAAIEILPKIAGAYTDTDARRVLIEMLRTLKDAPFKDLNLASLDTARMNVFEIFIAMFAAETAAIVKQGLKREYNSLEGSERFFKGKLNVSQNVKHNCANRCRFYVRYDERSANCPENRLIKAALLLLQKQSRDGRNRLSISRLLPAFDDAETPSDCKTDFSRLIRGRGTSCYERALAWCKVFLRENSFTAFSGSRAAAALLFPMEKVFESYVAAKLFVPAGAVLRTQDMRYSLFDRPEAFHLRPDIVLERGGEITVMDTKWKLLSDVRNYGISQADMYQMYAYAKKYGAGKVVLLYPQPGELKGKPFQSKDGVAVDVAFVDLLKLAYGETENIAV